MPKTFARGVIGAVIFFLSSAVFTDPKSLERVEIEALRNRNLVLADLAKSKGILAIEIATRRILHETQVSAGHPGRD